MRTIFSALHIPVPSLPATGFSKSSSFFRLDTVHQTHIASGLSCHMGALEGAAALSSEEHPAICTGSPRAQAPRTPGLWTDLGAPAGTRSYRQSLRFWRSDLQLPAVN